MATIQLDVADLCHSIPLVKRFGERAQALMRIGGVAPGSEGKCACTELEYDDKRRMVVALTPDGTVHLIPEANVARMVPHEDKRA